MVPEHFLEMFGNKIKQTVNINFQTNTMNYMLSESKVVVVVVVKGSSGSSSSSSSSSAR